MNINFVTIGVYNFSAEEFFNTLLDAGVDVFCDIRWRRGVRGSKYAFANHKRLQAVLESKGIHYIHRRDLAPTPEIRQQQKDRDKKERVAKRKRESLSAEFVASYREEILAHFDPQTLYDALPENTSVVALFCVEREPSACHRSLVAEELGKYTGASIEHLIPM